MKLYEIAQKAIQDQNAKLAEGLAIHLNRKFNLNYAGMMEYLKAHDVDPQEFEELLKEV